MSLHALATNMASKGRNGDSMLVHMTPGEVHGLQALAMKHGGSLTVNPDTGLPEANFLKSLLPILAGFALGPAGFGLVSSAMGAGAVVGGITGIATGSLSKGLMAGLGAYGGFGIGEALTGAGADAMTRTALSAEGALPSVDNIAQVTGEGYGGSAANYSDQVNSAVKAARDTSAAMPKADLLSAGAKAAAADPFGFAKQNMLPLGMAAAPIVADMMVPTTTKAPSPMAPGRIREKRWNGQYFEDVASTDAGVYNTSNRNFSDLYRGYNNGGIVALANGGIPGYAGATGSVVNYVPGQFDQATINAALAAELGTERGRGTSMEGFRNVAKDTYKLTDAQINAAFDTIPGFNAQGQFDAADYGASSGSGFKNTQLQVDAAKTARDAEYAANTDFLKNNSIQHSVINPMTGALTQLNQYHQDFNPDDTFTQAMLGQKVLGGDTGASNFFLNNPKYRPLADAAWAKEKARLNALDVAAGRIPADNKGLADLNQNKNLLTDGDKNLLTNQDQNKDKNADAGLAALDAGKSRTYKWFEERGLGFTPIDKVIDNWFDQYTDDLALLSARKQVEEMKDALDVSGMNEADLVKATGKTIAQWVQQKKEERKDGTKIIAGDLKDVPADSLPGGVSGGSNTFVNDNGTITTRPDLTLPMRDVRDTYTKGGGSLGYTSPSFDTLDEFTQQYVDDRMSGDSLAAYNYLSGKGGAKYPTKSDVGRIAEPYDEAVLGYPARGNLPFTYDKTTGKMVRNMDYVAPGRDAAGNVTYSMSLNDIKSSLKETPLSGQALYDWAISNNLSAQQIADATGRSLSSVYSDFRAGSKAAAKKKEDDKAAGIFTDQSSTGGSDGGGGGGGPGGTGPGGVGGAGGPGSTTAVGAGDIGPPDAVGGYYSRGKLNYRARNMAMGGATGYALGGLGTLGGYSDGGRLLRGPGDGVSDSIPATIGHKQQPARLADGEFVVPARIVSELGNGSTDAGAKKLYAMMDRVQRARGKTTGKNKVAANSRADKYLPA